LSKLEETKTAMETMETAMFANLSLLAPLMSPHFKRKLSHCEMRVVLESANKNQNSNL
jgi:hypothetical protein